MNNDPSQLVEEHPEIENLKFVKKNYLYYFLYYFLGTLTLGIVFLIFYWYPDLHLSLYRQIKDYKSATHVIFKSKSEKKICPVHKETKLFSPYSQKKTIKYVTYCFNHFHYDEEKKIFINISKTFAAQLNKRESLFTIEPLKSDTAEDLMNFYGQNIIKIPEPPFYEILAKGFFIPVNIYELCILIIDLIYKKYIYCLLLTVYMVVQTMVVIITELDKIRKINKLSEQYETVKVIRELNGVLTTLSIDSREIVIGDIMVMAPNTKLMCDLILIEGSCLVNEAVLTGESVPITKFATDKPKDLTSRNYLYSGSECLLLRSSVVKGVVVNTAWSTYKGSLVSILMNPKYAKFKFDNDFFLLNAFLLFVFCIVTGFLLYLDIKNDSFTLKKFLVRLTEMLTSAIPPSVLFAFYFTTYVVVERLRDKNITCLINEKIQECGRIKQICFDKTGTLTQNQVIVHSYAIVEGKKFEEASPDLTALSSYDNYRAFIEIMACCQSLNVLDGKLIGDPIEEQMFLKTGFKLLDKHSEDATITHEQNRPAFYQIVPTKEHKRHLKLPYDFTYKVSKMIDFTSHRKRMSVIIKNEAKDEYKYTLLCKGAPETIKTICDSTSVPSDYDTKLMNFSEQGYRVLAFAYKPLKEGYKDYSDTELEEGMKFIGFLLVDNPLKPQTRRTIIDLQFNGIKCAMITGDNLYTGINIGFNSGIINKTMNLWVGEYKPSKRICWNYFHNNQIIHDKEKESASNVLLIDDTSAISETDSRKVTNRITKEIERSVINTGDVDWIFDELKKHEDVVIALDGASFEYLADLYKDENEKMIILLDRTLIYGRAQPQHKELVINKLRNRYENYHYTVGFVGDGSNDCKALNAANLGLSIGDSESSITSSFSTNIDDIYPVMDIMVQGKFFLENCTQLYKIGIYSGLVEIFIIMLLGSVNLGYSNYQYALALLPWLPAFLLISITQPHKLNQLYPKPGLLNSEVLISILYSVLIASFFSGLLFVYMIYSENFKSVKLIFYSMKDLDFDNILSPEVMYMFIFNKIILIFVQLSMNRGFPFKQPVYTNIKYTLFAFCSFIIFTLFIFNDLFEKISLNPVFIHTFNIALVDEIERLKILGYILISCIIIVIVEKIVQGRYLIASLKIFKTEKCLKLADESMSNVSVSFK